MNTLDSKKHSFGFYTLFLYLFICIPTICTMIIGTQLNWHNAEKQIVSSENARLNIVMKQYDVDFSSINECLNTILYTDSYDWGSLKGDFYDTRYQQARIWLFNDLEDMKTNFPLVSGFYVRIPHTQDWYIARSTKEINLETQAFLKKQLSEYSSSGAPHILQYNGSHYLIIEYSNSFMTIGYIFSVEHLAEQFADMNDGRILTITVPGESAVLISEADVTSISKDCYILSKEFSSFDASLTLYMPKSAIWDQLAPRDRYLLAFSALILLLWPVFFVFLQKAVLAPMKKISTAMQTIIDGDDSYRIQNYSRIREYSEIEYVFNKLLDHNKELKIKAYEMQLEKEKERRENLQLQINPHLLLNSLNTIYSLASNKKYEEIQQFSLNLSRYFRYSLRNINEPVSLESELSFIKAYGKVQQIRYPGAFYIIYDISDELLDEKIPPLILQNFVENSIRYGQIPDKKIEIMVIVEKENGVLKCTVRDNGHGMSPALVSELNEGKIITDSRGRHIGIWNCQNRLHSFYSDHVSFHISSELWKGTEVVFSFPALKP